MTQRPGVMLYFDIAPAIKRLSAEESGLLLRAILDYAEQGVAPDFESDMLGHHRTIVSAAFAQSFAPSVQL